MLFSRDKEDLFEACSSDYGYRELADMPKGKDLTELYKTLRQELKTYYCEPKDAIYGFEDPSNKKHCWKTGNIDFAKLGLTWDEALIALQAVYADYPLLFFSDLYKTGGSPQGGYLAPVIDAESALGDFRRFYAERIEEEIRAVAKKAGGAASAREKAKNVYHIMSEAAKYDHSKGDEERIKYVDTPSHSILNYVRNRSGVCQGFAATYQAILNYLSIPAVTVTVNNKFGFHACNLVYLSDEKKWIMVDPTSGVSQKNDSGFDMPAGIYQRLPRQSTGTEFHTHMIEHRTAWEGYGES